MIYTDIAKAFDECERSVTAHKTRKMVINEKVGRWTYNFFTNTSIPDASRVRRPVPKKIYHSHTNRRKTVYIIASSFADYTIINMETLSEEDTEKLPAVFSTDGLFIITCYLINLSTGEIKEVRTNRVQNIG